MKAPFKVSYLIWLIFHNSLPTNVVRVQRKVASSDLCPRCKLVLEIADHCLHSCEFAQSIWSWLVFAEISNFFSLDLHGWLRMHAIAVHAPLCLATLWIIWCDCNDWVFNGSS